MTPTAKEQEQKFGQRIVRKKWEGGVSISLKLNDLNVQSEIFSFCHSRMAFKYPWNKNYNFAFWNKISWKNMRLTLPGQMLNHKFHTESDGWSGHQKDLPIRKTTFLKNKLTP